MGLIELISLDSNCGVKPQASRRGGAVVLPRSEGHRFGKRLSSLFRRKGLGTLLTYNIRAFKETTIPVSNLLKCLGSDSNVV